RRSVAHAVWPPSPLAVQRRRRGATPQATGKTATSPDTDTADRGPGEHESITRPVRPLRHRVPDDGTRTPAAAVRGPHTRSAYQGLMMLLMMSSRSSKEMNADFIALIVH